MQRLKGLYWRIKDWYLTQPQKKKVEINTALMYLFMAVALYGKAKNYHNLAFLMILLMIGIAIHILFNGIKNFKQRRKRRIR